MRSLWSAVLVLSVVSVGSAGPAGGSEARFVEAPVASRAGQAVRIEFAVSRATDVAVSIKDADGTVVRHLVAGVLGPKAPAPLKPNSLAQSLLWDGRDDAGRRVPAGRYRVEVALGLKPEFDRAFGWDPRALGTVHGLAVRADGALYVMSEVGRDSRDPRFQIFDATGEYVRTIVPRPAGLPLERVRPLNELVTNDGQRVPQQLLPQYGGRTYQVPVVTSEGDLIFLNGPTMGHAETKRFRSVTFRQEWPRRLLRIAADGGAPKAGYLGPLLGKQFAGRILYLALAPDGKTIYLSGARHAVFKVKWGEGEKPAPFVGTPDKPGSGAAGLNDPCGIAFDHDGNLYVADRGNHRIAVFTPDGTLVHTIRVEWPRQVLVHRPTGAIYVTAGYRRLSLLKFIRNKTAAPLATLDLRSSWPWVALDQRGERATLYVANVERRDVAAKRTWKALVKVVDAGDAFRVAHDLSGREGPMQPLLLGVDREREWVYGFRGIFGQYLRFDGRSTGEGEPVVMPLHPKANGIHELAVGADGTVAIHVSGEFGRLDHNLRPRPFAATGSHIVNLEGDDCIRSYYDRGGCVAPNGDIYWIHERGGYSQPMRVRAIRADGTVKKDSLIVFETRSPAGIRVDRDGAIYVVDHLKPVGKPVPDAFAGQVPITRRNLYVHHYGSLLKFKPTGGAVRERARGKPRKRDLADGQMQFTTAEGRGDFVVDGALWSYYGVSMIRPALDRVGCQCWTPKFDLDDFARVFVPDQLRCRITVLDTNGNVILHFGRYGNVDDRRAGIALADPRTVMVSREAAYVGDMTNNRIVRVRLSYRTVATAAADVPAAVEPVGDIEAAFAKPGLAVGRRRDLILAAARMRVVAVRREAVGLSPHLDRALDWSQVTDQLAAGEALPTSDDARVTLGLALRAVANWPEGEAKALLGSYLAAASDRVRLAAVWALWTRSAGDGTVPLLRRALTDRAAMVRVTAADTLLHHGDPSGLAEIFRAARSSDLNVYRLAETAILKKVLVWNAHHRQAGLIDGKALVPRYPMGRAEVAALAHLLESTVMTTREESRSYWYLRRSALYLLGLSGRPEAIPPLLGSLRRGEHTGNNLNRVIGGLGVLRARAAVPDLLKYVERGPGSDYWRERGDRAERLAAEALVRVADPVSVAPLIELLTSERRQVPQLARRTLSRLFDPGIPADRVLVPKAGKLVRVRVDDVPEPAALRAAWEAFWRDNRAAYPWNDDGAPLKPRQVAP